jgi:hypothetical protein
MAWFATNWGYVLGALYGVGMLGTHIFPDNTVAFKFFKWLVAGANGPASVAAFVKGEGGK